MSKRYEIAMIVGPCSEKEVERIMEELTEKYEPQLGSAVGFREWVEWADELTPIQRHRLTCPLCGILSRNGVEQDAHLISEHGLNRDERFALFQRQAREMPA